MKILVLSIGGARGSYHAGIIEALERQGWNPDVIVGTSTGGLSALGAAARGSRGLMKIWTGISGREDLFTLALPLDGLWNPAPLYRLVDEVAADFRGNGHVMEGGSPRLIIPFTDQCADEPVIHDTAGSFSEELADAVKASATVPVLMPALDGRYVDGGLWAPCFVDAARQCFSETEHNEIVVVCARARQQVKLERLPFPAIVWNGVRSIQKLMWSQAWDEIDELLENRPAMPNTSVRVFAPPRSWDAGDFDFSHSAIMEGIQLGLSDGFMNRIQTVDTWRNGDDQSEIERASL